MNENRVRIVMEVKADNATKALGRTKGEMRNLKEEASSLKTVFSDLEFLNTVMQDLSGFSAAFKEKELHNAIRNLEQESRAFAECLSQNLVPALRDTATELDNIVKPLKEICNIADKLPPEISGALIGAYAGKEFGKWGMLGGAAIGVAGGYTVRLHQEKQQEERYLEAARNSLGSGDALSTVTPSREQVEAIKAANQAAQELADGGGAIQAAKQAARDMAVVTEQARAGLIETREVGLGVYDEWITAQAKWINEQDRAVRKAVQAGNDFANGWRAGMNEYVNTARDSFRQTMVLAMETARSMEQSFSDFFFDAMQGELKGFEDYLNSFVVSVQRAVADMAAQRMTASMISGIGGLFSAHGNVFSRGQVLPFASGGVISSPTLFPLGLMGEAGPEAILPLQRTRSGDLGVKAEGQGGGDVVNVNFTVVANDSRSFRDSMIQNKAAILGVVQEAYNRRGKRGPLA